jgi:hypothetical protein
VGPLPERGVPRPRGARRPLRALAAAAVALAAAVGVARAEDVLVLESGRRVRGRIVAEEEERVRLAVDGGEVWYPRSSIKRILRDRPATGESEPAAARAPGLRAEYALLTSGGRRAGARRFVVQPREGGVQFEEHLVFLGEKGEPTLSIHTLERCDDEFRPVSFQVREGGVPGKERSVRGEVRHGRLDLTVSEGGKRTKRSLAMPGGARLRFAARELFLRRTAELGGKLTATVFDTRDQRWRAVRYEEDGLVAPAQGGGAPPLRRVLRKRGEQVERETLDAQHRAVRAELNGGSLVALRTTEEVFTALREGDLDRVTGEESRERTWYVDPVLGFRVAKPAERWTFELPLEVSVGTLLVLRYEEAFATVDVQRDLSAPADVTLERAGEALRRQCAAVSTDFELVEDGYETTDQGRVYWFRARARTKGQKTETLARVLIAGGRVYRLLAACPPAFYEGVEPDFRLVLDSFRAGRPGVRRPRDGEGDR